MFQKFAGAGLAMACGAALAERAPTADDLMFKRPAVAEKARVGIAVDASALLGIGISVGVPVAGGLTSRVVYHHYSYDFEHEDDGGNYNAELSLKSYGALLDYHPFAGVFRITGGLMSNGNKLNLAGRPDGSGVLEVGDCKFNSSASDPLSVSGNADFRSMAPYLGLGWGGNMYAAPGFFGTFDIGVMFSGAPKPAFGAQGSGSVAEDGECGSAGTPVNASDPAVQDQLRQAEADFKDDTKDFKLWPNIAFGLGWRF